MSVLLLLTVSGCGPAAHLIMSAAGGAAAVSDEPQRIYSTQRQDFDEQHIALLDAGAYKADDVVVLIA